MRARDHFRAGLHTDRILPHAQAGGIAPRLAGTDVKFPAVPGAFHHLSRTRITVVARHLGFDEAGLDAEGETAAAMRAAIVESEEIAGEIEHHDGATVYLDKLARARPDLIDARNNVAGHSISCRLG